VAEVVIRSTGVGLFITAAAPAETYRKSPTFNEAFNLRSRGQWWLQADQRSLAQAHPLNLFIQKTTQESRARIPP
jgi:hypothetical protein